MPDQEAVQNPKGDFFGWEPGVGNSAAASLAEQELDRVVGGYIGETEKNLRPIREAGLR
jgi:hypothetical protein